jgi:hypothetical protein
VGEARRKRAEEALAEGRRLLESGDVHGALRLLDRARKDFVQEDDLGGLRELRKVVEDGYRLADAQDEPAYERLLYASAQNVRFLSRKRAAEAKVPWEDPHPELDQPGRPEMRAERGVTKRDVPWIAAGAVVAAALIAGIVLLVVFADSADRRGITNDSDAPVVVGLCDNPCDTVAKPLLLKPGEQMSWKTSYDRFAISKPSGTRVGCVDATRHARVSDAGSC